MLFRSDERIVYQKLLRTVKGVFSIFFKAASLMSAFANLTVKPMLVCNICGGRVFVARSIWKILDVVVPNIPSDDEGRLEERQDAVFVAIASDDDLDVVRNCVGETEREIHADGVPPRQVNAMKLRHLGVEPICLFETNNAPGSERFRRRQRKHKSAQSRFHYGKLRPVRHGLSHKFVFMSHSRLQSKEALLR